MPADKAPQLSFLIFLALFSWTAIGLFVFLTVLITVRFVGAALGQYFFIPQICIVKLYIYFSRFPLFSHYIFFECL